jgi:excisionase family DNA binding protein
MGVKDEPLPRPEDDAHLLAVSKATVYRLALSGEIASARARGCFRLRREAMDDFVALAEQTVMPKRQSPLRRTPRKQGVSDAA